METNTTAVPPVELPIWKTLKLGNLKTADEFRSALKIAGRSIGKGAWVMPKELIEYSVAKNEEEADLVLIPRQVLEEKHGLVRLGSGRNFAFDYGLVPPSYEVALQLAVQYSDQPEGENLLCVVEDLAPDSQVVEGAGYYSRVKSIPSLCYRTVGIEYGSKTRKFGIQGLWLCDDESMSMRDKPLNSMHWGLTTMVYVKPRPHDWKWNRKQERQ